MNALTPTRQRRVMIGTPCMDGRPEARYTYCLAETVRLAERAGLDLRPVIQCYDAILPNLRNQIARAAVENRFDDLIWIDADIDWQPEWIDKLLTYPVDCVGGTYRKKTDATETYEVSSTVWPLPIDPVTGLLQVTSLGAGFLRLSSRALEMLWESSTPYRCRSEPPTHMVFEYGLVNGEHLGEDTMLSRKLKALGIATYLDPSMTCGHTGSKQFAGDFAKWLEAETARRAQLAAA